jgi:hypothetical protein
MLLEGPVFRIVLFISYFATAVVCVPCIGVPETRAVHNSRGIIRISNTLIGIGISISQSIAIPSAIPGCLGDRICALSLRPAAIASR